jgi:hypothetical protein
MRAPVAYAIALIAGGITLLGYFFSIPILDDLRTRMLGWAVILVGIATLVGSLNLVGVHWRKLTAKKGRDLYSLFFLVAFIVTLGSGLWLTPMDTNFQQVVTSIQLPVETSLLALLAITLTVACFRLPRRGRGWMGVIFIISVLVFLILDSGIIPLSGNSILSDASATIHRLPTAGARGILLGIALGSLTTGLRIFLGTDRPYSG